MERFGVGPSDTVLDPFCGTGTTLVECKKLRIPSVGIEASPMAHFASSVKVDWQVRWDEMTPANRYANPSGQERPCPRRIP